jgi:hypothetical protein
MQMGEASIGECWVKLMALVAILEFLPQSRTFPFAMSKGVALQWAIQH